MRPSDLRLVGQPAIAGYVAEPPQTYELAWRLAKDELAVRVLRGNKMRSAPRLFDEFGAALQFPDYFGENWAAFEECVTDLSWLPAAGYVLLIVRSEEVLADEDDETLDLLRRILVRASERWATPVAKGESWDRPARPFHVVLQIPPERRVLAMDRWAIADADTLQDID